METPQEIEVWYVLPAIRRKLAFAMKEQGKSQKEIAKLLDITEAAVSQYLHKKRAKECKLSRTVLTLIKKSAANISSKKDAMEHVQKILNLANEEKLICRIHKSQNSKLKTCEVCFR